MRPISPNKAGLVFGSLAGHGICYGPCWYWSDGRSRLSILYFDSFIKPVYVIGPFNAGIALILSHNYSSYRIWHRTRCWSAVEWNSLAISRARVVQIGHRMQRRAAEWMDRRVGHSQMV
jgi:hypothetical protein